MRRTQIYLDEDHKRALKILATTRDANVSDLIREAIERLLRDEFAGADWRAEMRRLQKSMLKQLGGGVGEERLHAALKQARAEIAREDGENA